MRRPAADARDSRAGAVEKAVPWLPGRRPPVRLVAVVQRNAHLLRQGGADNVITSSGAAGRLLALGIRSPTVAAVLEDLLVGGEGLDLMEQRVERDGMTPAEAAHNAPVMAVVRDRETLRFDDPRAQRLEAGDRLICLCVYPDAGA